MRLDKVPTPPRVRDAPPTRSDDKTDEESTSSSASWRSCSSSDIALPSASELATPQASSSPPSLPEVFGGVVKSYNARRGFGFLACEETAQRFGRDVYLSKLEVTAAVGEDIAPLKEG